MNMQPPAIPEYASGLADIGSFHRSANAHAFGGTGFGSHVKARAQWITTAAVVITAIIVVAATLVSAPVDRADTAISHDGSTFDDRIRHNIEAFRHSRAWWESYGQRRRPESSAREIRIL